jgi:hypothetical protein
MVITGYRQRQLKEDITCEERTEEGGLEMFGNWKRKLQF